MLIYVGTHTDRGSPVEPRKRKLELAFYSYFYIYRGLVYRTLPGIPRHIYRAIYRGWDISSITKNEFHRLGNQHATVTGRRGEKTN